MLKREIKYEDFNGEEAIDTFYFNISKAELIELEVEYDKGFGKFLQSVVESKDNKELVKRFKEIILMAYGEKSPDGKRFVKNEQIREEFSQTAAFQSLFLELASDEKAAAAFVEGVLPRDVVGQIDQDKPVAIPPSQAPAPPNS